MADSERELIQVLLMIILFVEIDLAVSTRSIAGGGSEALA